MVQDQVLAVVDAQGSPCGERHIRPSGLHHALGDTRPISRDYKLVVANTSLSRFGTSAFDLMILWVLLRLTSSPFLAGLGEGMLSLPLFFSFLLGAVVDRSSHRKALAGWATGLRVIAPLLVVASMLLHSEGSVIASLFLAAFLVGLTSDLLNSVRASWTKDLLLEGQYVMGSSLASAASSIADAAGYGLAGFFLEVGFGPAFALLAAVYLISSLPLVPLRVAEREIAASKSDVIEGLRFVKSTPFLLQLIAIGTVLNLVFGMSGVMIASLVQIKFHLPSIYMSALILSLMTGMMAGSAASSGMRGRVGPKAAILVFLLGIAAAFMAFLNIYEEPIAALVLGGLIGVLNVMLNAVVLKMVPPELMARVTGAFNTFSLAVTFASGAFGGILISATSVGSSFLIVGFVVAATAPLWLIGEAARAELPAEGGRTLARGRARSPPSSRTPDEGARRAKSPSDQGPPFAVDRHGLVESLIVRSPERFSRVWSFICALRLSRHGQKDA